MRLKELEERRTSASSSLPSSALTSPIRARSVESTTRMTHRALVKYCAQLCRRAVWPPVQAGDGNIERGVKKWLSERLDAGGGEPMSLANTGVDGVRGGPKRAGGAPVSNAVWLGCHDSRKCGRLSEAEGRTRG